jgi:predicted dienelactone hydrolase
LEGYLNNALVSVMFIQSASVKSLRLTANYGLVIALLVGGLTFNFPSPLTAKAAAQPGSSLTESYKSPGKYKVGSVSYDWKDQKRNRQVPVKIYFPIGAHGPFPVVIFSHGLGGDREGYGYLGQHWASHGYVSVHVQHLGSDSALWENKPFDQIMPSFRKAAANLENAKNRPPDISFAIDQLEKLNQQDPRLKHLLNLQKIGVAGHSFGAWTTLAVAGQVFTRPNGEQVSMPDPRVKAIIPMSAPMSPSMKDADAAFAKIKLPCLHMTGTLDSSPIGETTVEERRIPFDHMRGADEFLITFNGGDHMIFSGRGMLPGGDKDETFQSYIAMSSIAFWDAYLLGDAKAKAWLKNGGLKSALGDEGKLEVKPRK